MFLIERIHQTHLAKRIHDETCALCVELRQRQSKARPAWFRNLTAKEMTA